MEWDSGDCVEMQRIAGTVWKCSGIAGTVEMQRIAGTVWKWSEIAGTAWKCRG